jgi:diguanylate cyclase (GGDEF)-like protein
MWPTGRIAAVSYSFTVVAAVALVAAVLSFPVRPEIGLPFSVAGIPPTTLGILLWTAVALVGSRTGSHEAGRGAVDAGIAPIIAAMALGGPSAAVWVAVVGTLEPRYLRGEIPWYGVLANQAMQVVAAVGGAVVYGIVDATFQGGSGEVSLLATACAAAVFCMLVFAMASLVVWARTGRAPAEAFAISLSAIRNWMVAETAIGWLGATCYASVWWSPFAVLVANIASAASLAAGQEGWLLRHHQLTGLPNARGLRERVAEVRRGSREGLCVFYIDLDGFKAVNDQFGHDAGDDVLVEVARRLEASRRDRDFVAHLHGDEFVLLAEQVADLAAAASIAARLGDAIEAPIIGGDAAIAVGASVGYELLTDPESLDEALRMADKRMAVAKCARAAAAGRVRRQAGAVTSESG